MRILVIGDSIVYGAWDNEGGWADRLKREFHTITTNSIGDKKIQVFNLGIGGNSSEKILERLDSEINSRHSEKWSLVLLFQFCANDAREVQGNTEVDQDKFSQNSLAIIDIAKKYTNKILFIGEPPLSKDEVMLNGKKYNRNKIAMYETRLKEIVENERTAFVDLSKAFKNTTKQLYSYDGIHPNDTGHELIYLEVKKALEGIIS